MRILLVTPMPPQRQPTNSVPLVTHAAVMRLRQQHHVTVVSVAGPDQEELVAADALHNVGIDIHTVRRLPTHGFQRLRRGFELANGFLVACYPFRTAWYHNANIQRMIDRLIAQQRFDIIIVADNAMAIYHYPHHIPKVLIEMEVRRPRAVNWRGFPKASWRQWAWNEIDWQRWPNYQRTVWNKFDQIEVFTERDAQALLTIAPELHGRVHINPFGIELPDLNRFASEDQDTLVFSGGFAHLPNVEAALWLGNEIMPKLRQRRPGTKLIIVGSFPPAAVQALARADIIVTGRVPNVEPFLEQASVIVAPVHIGGGMRMKVLQGMAHGKAVVTTSLGIEGLRWASHRPPVALVEDADAAVETITQLLNDVDARRALGEKARAYVAKHFSDVAYAQRLESLFTQMVEHRRMVGQPVSSLAEARSSS